MIAMSIHIQALIMDQGIGWVFFLVLGFFSFSYQLAVAFGLIVSSIDLGSRCYLGINYQTSAALYYHFDNQKPQNYNPLPSYLDHLDHFQRRRRSRLVSYHNHAYYSNSNPFYSHYYSLLSCGMIGGSFFGGWVRGSTTLFTKASSNQALAISFDCSRCHRPWGCEVCRSH